MRDLCCSLLLLFLLVSPAWSATYYISPTGNNSNPGTSQASPWRTFTVAVSRMVCGDTLLLLNGTYTRSTSGYLHLANRNCSAGAPLTFRALQERQAWIAYDGQHDPSGNPQFDDGIGVINSAFLVFEGLRVSDVDSAAAWTNAVFVIGSHHITFRKMLVHNNNRFYNAHLFDLQNSSFLLIEDSELYNFHRHGMTLPDNSIARRVYCNSRLFPCAIPGGGTCFSAGLENQRGDACVALYPASNAIVENVISENNDHLVEINGSGLCTNNHVLGSVSLNDVNGAYNDSRGYAQVQMIQNTVYQDFVAIGAGTNAVPGSATFGFLCQGCLNVRCDNCTILNSVASSGQGGHGFLTKDTDAAQYETPPSFFSDNSLLAGNAGFGAYITTPTFQLDFTDFFANGGVSSPPVSDPRITNERTINPQLGTCRVYLPDASPLKTAGKNGGPIGANILYRYVDGNLTTQPLWNPTTGQFPCGATVAGLNNTAGNSCINVHERLNVNVNGCPFPAGYGGGGGVTLSVSPTSVPAGGTVTATWAGIPSPTPTDWLGLYMPGANDTAYLAWRYTTGAASGAVPFTIPGTIAPGTYELRLFSNNGFTRLASSNSFTVR